MCTMDGGTTDHAYPRRSDPKYNAFNLGITTFTTDTFTVNVGISTIVNYNVSNASYTPTTGQLTLNIGAHSLKSGVTTTVQSADYSPVTGIMTVTIANHEYSAGERVKFDAESLNLVALMVMEFIHSSILMQLMFKVVLKLVIKKLPTEQPMFLQNHLPLPINQ